MSNALLIAFEITLIGMGLVFGAILLLWLVMAVLVRLTTEKTERLPAPADDLKRRAAAAAVGLALAEETSSRPRHFPLPPTALVSAWQVVMRSRAISRRGKTR